MIEQQGNWEFSDKLAAERELEWFFDRCSQAVRDGDLTDAVDVGVLAHMLEVLVVSLGSDPAQSREGFAIGHRGEWVRDDDWGLSDEFMQRALRAAEADDIGAAVDMLSAGADAVEAALAQAIAERDGAAGDGPA